LVFNEILLLSLVDRAVFQLIPIFEKTILWTIKATRLPINIFFLAMKKEATNAWQNDFFKRAIFGT
jgi:hypothetical protein